MLNSFYVNSPDQSIIGKIDILAEKANLYKDVRTFFSMSPHFFAKISTKHAYKSSKRTNEGKFPMWNEQFNFFIDDPSQVLNFTFLDSSTFVRIFLK